MDNEDISVVEWEIENFTCWSNEIHGEEIQCEGLHLYPRGVRGTSECLEVKFEKSTIEEPMPEVTFVASDGSLICTVSEDRRVSDMFHIYSPGPRWNEVVPRIKEKEHMHKDRLILRWQTSKKLDQSCYYYFHSIICVYDWSVELDSMFFDNLKIEDLRNISVIAGPPGFSCSVYACKSDTDIKKFKIERFDRNNKKKILVRTTFSIPKAEGITKIFEEDFLLKRTEERLFSFLLPEKNANEKIFVTFKMITGRYETFCHISDFSQTAKITHPRSLNSHENVVSGNPNALVSIQGVTVLVKELTCLYQDHDFSDFELRCGTVSFPTHRGILSARSPVFKAMLSGDMREAVSGHVAVEDLDPHTVGRFLSFIYSGTCEDLEWEGALRLYYAADKYQVPSLKEECAAVLYASVSLENVCDILSLADKHQDEELRSVAHDFILKNYNDVLGSENWEKFMSGDSLLVAKTLTHFAKNKLVKKSDST